MLAPGWGIGDWVRAELGLVTALGDTTGGKFDLELRPMFVLAPPMVPVYGRAIFAVTNLLNSPIVLAYGAAVGVGISLGGIGLFGEVGILPRSIAGTFVWILEGRLGVYYLF